MIFVLAVAAVVAGATLGYWLGIRERWAWFLGFMLLFAGVFAWLMTTGPTLPGHDGLGRVYLAVLAVLPLEIGGLVGAGIALIRHRRDRHD